MALRCGLLVAVLLAGLAGGCAASKPALDPVVFTSEPWSWRQQRGTKLTTEHYDLYTTLKDAYLVESFPELVEAAFAFYQQLVPPARSPEERMSVFLFASRGQWAMFTREFTGARAPVFLQVRNGGYSERGVSVIQYVSHQTTFPLLAHEGFHQYLHHYVNPNVPAWLNEGLAVMCEGQRWGTAGLKSFDPWYNPFRRNNLAEAILTDRLYPLQELLDTHAGRIVGGSTRAVSTYYAQLWALMLFLREGEGGRYAQAFDRMCETLDPEQLEPHLKAARIWAEGAQVSRGEALFRAFISEDIPGFEAEFRGFLRERMLDR